MNDMLNYLFPGGSDGQSEKPSGDSGKKDKKPAAPAVQPTQEEKIITDYEAAIKDIFASVTLDDGSEALKSDEVSREIFGGADTINSGGAESGVHVENTRPSGGAESHTHGAAAPTHTADSPIALAESVVLHGANAENARLSGGAESHTHGAAAPTHTADSPAARTVGAASPAAAAHAESAKPVNSAESGARVENTRPSGVADAIGLNGTASRAHVEAERAHTADSPAARTVGAASPVAAARTESAKPAGGAESGTHVENTRPSGVTDAIGLSGTASRVQGVAAERAHTADSPAARTVGAASPAAAARAESTKPVNSAESRARVGAQSGAISPSQTPSQPRGDGGAAERSSAQKAQTSPWSRGPSQGGGPDRAARTGPAAERRPASRVNRDSPSDRIAAMSAGSSARRRAAEGGEASKRGGRISKQQPPKKKKTPKARLAMNIDEYLRRDLIIFNNPVLIGGLAVTPVVAAATTLQNALALCVAVLILVVPTRVLGDLVSKRVPMWLRPMLYAFTGAVLYIPAHLAVTLLFGTPNVTLGMYLPLLAVDTIVLSRSEIKVREGVLTALRNGTLTSLGFALTACTFGAVREILSQGRIMGIKIIDSSPLKFAGTVGGGLILTAVAAALFQSMSAAYRNAHPDTIAGKEDGNV